MQTQEIIDNKSRALAEGIRRAVAELSGVNLAERCRQLALPTPADDGRLRFDMLGRTVELSPPTFEGTVLATGQPMHPVDRLLALHYLLFEGPVRPSGRWISFRAFPGGMFYLQPFLKRTTLPLTAEIGNDLPLLQRRLGRLSTRRIEGNDLAVAVNVLGAVNVALIYRSGDEEFPPRADILFDSSLPFMFSAEDAVTAAGRVCRCLCRQPCQTCGGCGLCDRGLK
jgi:uncharacterized protein DUF3786